LSGIRWTTRVGVAVGGVGGALAALLGAPAKPAPLVAPVTSSAPAASTAPVAPASVVAAETAATPSAPPSAEPTPVAEATPSAAPPATSITPALELPTTIEALLKAELFCDQKKLYDECSRAAEALEKGTAGPADAKGAKRFRRIALTYLVTECEVGDPHACFVMAGKYRDGTELAASPVRAAALEQRGRELCRLRSAPECPAK
jgi:hypothetical protein